MAQGPIRDLGGAALFLQLDDILRFYLLVRFLLFRDQTVEHATFFRPSEWENCREQQTALDCDIFHKVGPEQENRESLLPPSHPGGRHGLASQ